MPTRESSKSILPDKPGHLSQADLQAWLTRETAAAKVEFDLRVKEATDLVSQFVSGQISQEEANDRYWRYQQRWGEPLTSTDANPDDPGTQFHEDTTPSLTKIREMYKVSFNRESGE
jgi:hypothetical protein